MKQIRLKIPSPLQQLSLHSDSTAAAKAVKYKLWCKRDDLIHPVMSGNKWRKLAHSFHTHQDIRHIISYGGGFSNHLHALGYFCHKKNIQFTARIRGDYRQHPTPMITDLSNWGTQIEYLNKDAFKLAREQSKYGYKDGLLHIPEGGFNQSGLQGVSDIIKELLAQHLAFSSEPVTIVLPVATGTTLAGLAKHAPNHWFIQGIAVLKGEQYLEQNVQSLIGDAYTNWHINHAYHAGGYAKTNAELNEFLTQWDHAHCPIERIYSGKAAWGLQNLVNEQKINSKHIIYLHTGGLQGARKA